MRCTRLGGFTAGDELFFGELADRLQHRKPGPSRSHRKPGPSRGSVGDQQRLTDQGVEQIEDYIFIDVIGSVNCACALEVESPGEDRTPFQQCLFGVVEQVVGPCYGMTQRLVAC